MMNLIRTSNNQLVIDDPGQELRNHFAHIRFHPEEHRYFNEQGEEYMSVSGVLDKFIPPFNREFYSDKIAREKQVSQDEIKAVWDIRREYSIVKGTEFHLYVQAYLTHNRMIELQTPIKREVASFHRFWDKIRDRYKVIASELIVADDEYKIAGTVDCVVQNLETEEYFIFDWKTNRKITKTNPVSKMMLPPVDHLEQCGFNKYALQMSFYRFLFNKNTPIDISQTHLVHLTPDGYKIYSPQDYQQEVKVMIASFKENTKHIE